MYSWRNLPNEVNWFNSMEREPVVSKLHLSLEICLAAHENETTMETEMIHEHAVYVLNIYPLWILESEKFSLYDDGACLWIDSF